MTDLKRIVFTTWWNVPINAFSFKDATLTKNGEKYDGKDVRYISLRAKGDDWFGNHFICFVCDFRRFAERAAEVFHRFLEGLACER